MVSWPQGSPSLMLKQGVHTKIVQERLGHASIQITLDIYSHVVPDLQEAAAESFDNLVSPKYNDAEAVENHYWQKVVMSSRGNP